ncbi:hypothetical protein GGD66_002289 [Bradyrhizobium sp. CIR48]|nr:hypothetical protein [Bradyrhizobium sp. CIR48]
MPRENKGAEHGGADLNPLIFGPAEDEHVATTDAYAALPVTQTSQLEPKVGDETGQSH